MTWSDAIQIDLKIVFTVFCRRIDTESGNKNNDDVESTLDDAGHSDHSDGNSCHWTGVNSR